MLAALVFLIAAVVEIVNGPDIKSNPWFWLFAGLCVLCAEGFYHVRGRSLLGR